MPSALFSVPQAVITLKLDSTTLFMKPFSPIVMLNSTALFLITTELSRIHTKCSSAAHYQYYQYTQ